MPNYKLHYFPLRYRGEVARLLFAAADVKYEDYRIPNAEWPGLMKNYWFGTLPALEIDGKMVCNQSRAMFFFLADTFKFGTSGPLDNARALEICGAVDDYHDGAVQIFFCPDGPEKQKKVKDWTETIKFYIDALEKYCAPSAKDGFLVGGKLSVADLVVFNSFDTMDSLGVDSKAILAKAPTLAANRAKIAALPKIKAYLDKRPKTPF
jgi:glutathione S-transferase